MKKLTSLVLGLFIAMGMASVADACTPAQGCTDTYHLTDTTLFSADGTDALSQLVHANDGNVNYLSGAGDYVTWRHQYSFNPLARSIERATLTLSLRDDVRGVKRDLCFGGDGLEFAWLSTEAGVSNIWEVNSGDDSFKINLTRSLLDGSFEVTLWDVCGDFYIDKSVLDIFYCPVPVPEPGTMVLLGVGLLGLAIFGKRRMNKT